MIIDFLSFRKNIVLLFLLFLFLIIIILLKLIIYLFGIMFSFLNSIVVRCLTNLLCFWKLKKEKSDIISANKSAYFFVLGGTSTLDLVSKYNSGSAQRGS